MEDKQKSKNALEELELKEKIKALEILNEELKNENEKIKTDLEEYKSMNSKLLLKLTNEIDAASGKGKSKIEDDDEDDENVDEELKAIRDKITKHNEEINKIKEESENEINK